MADEGRWEAIQEKLAWFAEQDAAATVFGASQHRWRLVGRRLRLDVGGSQG